LLLFFTGYSRSASAILKEQDQKSKQADAEMIENLHFVKDLGPAKAGGVGSRGFARVCAAHGCDNFRILLILGYRRQNPYII